MNRRLTALILVFAVLLVGCNGNVPPTASATNAPATAEPTEAIPTDVPTNTAVPTQELTATVEPTPTEVLTPTATPIPTVWEIAQQMLVECAGARPMPTEGEMSVDHTYQEQLEARVLQNHPEFPGNFFLQIFLIVLANDGVPPNGAPPSPFAYIDLPEGTALIPEMRICEGYVLALEYPNAENFDRDGVLAGEAYLFYEVGGTQPYVLDGELKEVRFTFPPIP